MIFDLTKALSGEQEVTFEVRLLQEQPSFPYDINNFKEPNWTTYAASLLTEIRRTSFVDGGTYAIDGGATFTYNGPDDGANCWGYYITAKFENIPYLIEVKEFTDVTLQRFFVETKHLSIRLIIQKFVF